MNKGTSNVLSVLLAAMIFWYFSTDHEIMACRRSSCTTSTLEGHCHEHGKTPLATAWGYTACLQGYAVLFASAIEVINTLTAAKNAGRLKQELKKYTKPALLILDELGYLPIDKAGADLLCQVISRRYEQGAIRITSHRALKDWPKICNNDSTLTAAILDRLLHHAETVIIEGKSFRMQDQLDG
jgi:DNA replication protein DnaC